MSIVNTIALAAIGAIGLNILNGYTGQISLGQGAFMAVGGYTAAILSSRYGMPFWFGILAGGSMAALVGTLFGIPSLRIKGLYLAIATLAAQLIIEWTINHVRWIGGGRNPRSTSTHRPFWAWRSTMNFGAIISF